MGEIADMMLDGMLCQECGVFIDDDQSGYPRSCKSCAMENQAAGRQMVKIGKTYIFGDSKPREKCPHCNKKVKVGGLDNHIKDAHIKCPHCPRMFGKGGLKDHIKAKHPEKQIAPEGDLFEQHAAAVV